ncbi:MAG: ribosome-binding factor A [Candidatus Terrybacteria bacterium RIFCSPLOWO2_01_FULL_48_14]|nr:MAG: ribosome-binding factor A [Candidatus Terrybacteria bacterium RIFCSPLOWO2_01_FULL_48_14]
MDLQQNVGIMATERRQKQVDVLMQEELAKILNREMDIPPDLFLTVTRVDVAPNLAAADVFVSVLPGTKAGQILQELAQRTFEFQQMVNKRLRMRPVPRIRFLLDNVEAQAAEIEEELYKIRKLGNRE